jgi:hypothetical protein
MGGRTMKRRKFLMLAIVLTGCSVGQKNLYEVLPENVEGGWVREQVRAMSAEDAAQDIRSLGLKQWAQASYRGPGRVTAQVFEMSSETGVFELVQKMQRADAPVFQKGTVLVICKPEPGTDGAALSGFAKALERALRV